jgi:hypothetical protein
MDHDQACLIMIHAITLRLLELTGTHPMATHFVANELRTLGYTPDEGVEILQGAFRETARYEEAEKLVNQISKVNAASVDTVGNKES